MGTAKAFAYASIAAGGAALVFLREFSKIQNAEAAFTPLLGGAEKARLAVQKLNETAASTPFSVQTLASSAERILPALNNDLEKTISVMRMLGDASGGDSQKLSTLTNAYSKAANLGRVSMEELNMIAEAGIPIYAQLAESMGTTVNAKFKKSISDGKVSIDDLTKAFDKMTREGGIFFNGMEIASRTLTGVYSTTKDNASQLAADIGGIIEPAVKRLLVRLQGTIKTAREWIAANRELIAQKFEKFVERLGKAIAWIIEHRVAIGRTITTIVALVVVVKVLTAVLLLLNLAMMANPIGLIVVAIAAFIAVLTTLWVKWDKIQKAFVEAPTWLKAVYLAMLLITGPVGMLVVGVIALAKNWDKVKVAAVGAWDVIVTATQAAIASIKNALTEAMDMMIAFINMPAKLSNKLRMSLGLDPKELLFETSDMKKEPSLQTRSNAQQSQTVSGEVIIRDETNRAEVSKTGGTFGLRVQNTGAFAQ